MAALLITKLGKVLGNTYECISYPCAACCDCTGKVLCSPFTPYLFATLGFNIPPLVWAYKSIAAAIQSSSCLNGGKTVYLWMNGLLAVCHLIGSMYIIFRIQQSRRYAVSDDEDIENLHSTIKRIYSGGSMARIDEDSHGNSYKQLGVTKDTSTKKPAPIQSVASTLASLNPDRTDKAPGTVDDGPPSSFRRLGQVLCYDVGVAGYIVIVFFWMLWQSFGLWVAISSAGTDYYDNNDDAINYVEVCGNMRLWVIVSIVCGFTYMSIVFFFIWLLITLFTIRKTNDTWIIFVIIS